MDQTASVISENLKRLKEELHLSNHEIGEILGTSRQTIANYLSGKQIIDSAKLFKLARYADVPLRYFFAEKRPNAFSFMFRADNPKENVDESFTRFIDKKLNSYCDILELGDEDEVVFLPESYRLSISGKTLSKDEKEIIRSIAEKQRKALGIEGDANIDIYSVLERNHIHIYTFLHSNLVVDALSAYSKEKGAFILLEDHAKTPEERKIFSVVHELAHLIFHRDEYGKETEELAYKNYKKDLKEKVANHFASYFLIPRDLLAEFDFYFKKGRYFSLDDLMELKREFRVSAQAMLMALKEEKYIDSRIYGYLLKRLKESGYEKNEPDPMPPIRKNQKLAFLLKNLIIDEKITTNKLSEVLNLDMNEARRLAKEWANVH